LNPRFDAASRRRSERVLLHIRLLLETRLEDGKLAATDAFTLVVNAHGGLLELHLKLPRGHRIWLINTGTGIKAPCRVLGTRKSREGGFATAFEFEQASPDFWPINFPPRDWHLVDAK
jgi:hypothetical protein